MFITWVENSAAQDRQGFLAGAIAPGSTTLSFRQDLNIYEWLYRLDYEKKIHKKLQFTIRENFRSTLQSISSRDLWKDNQQLTTGLNYAISKKLTARAELTSHLLSDQLAGFDNDVNFHSGAVSMIYESDDKVRIVPAIKSKWQTQLQQSDQGLGYSLRTDINDVDFYGYRNDISVVGELDHFPQRSNHDFVLRYRIERQFYEATADTFTLIVERLRRDSFDSDSDGLFVRKLIQENRGFENRLSYRLAPKATVFMRNAVLSSGFKVDNLRPDGNEIRKDDTGFESRHSLRLHYNSTSWFARVGWSYRFRTRDDNRRQEIMPDPFGRFPTVGFDTEDVLVTLDMNSGFKIGTKDSLGFFSSVSKFQYDTSDTTNPNDHDQIKWQFTFTHAHFFNPELKLVWRAGAFLNHFVFIASRFSGGNNWERNFQIKPEIIYTPGKRFSFRQAFLVRAKYQTFDFDNAETSNRNIVNRQFIVTNTTHYLASRRSRLELSFNIELAEQGRFFHDLWRQTLALSWRNSEVRALYRYHFDSHWQVASGGFLFRQIRYEHNLNSQGTREKRVRDKHTNLGPLLEISYRPSTSLELLFSGNIQFASSSRRNTENINSFDLNLNWFF